MRIFDTRCRSPNVIYGNGLEIKSRGNGRTCPEPIRHPIARGARERCSRPHGCVNTKQQFLFLFRISLSNINKSHLLSFPSAPFSQLRDTVAGGSRYLLIANSQDSSSSFLLPRLAPFSLPASSTLRRFPAHLGFRNTWTY